MGNAEGKDRMNSISIIGDRQFIHKTLSVSLHVRWCCVPQGATQKAFKTLNYRANVYKYCKIHDKGACQLQQEYDCNIQYTF